MGFPVGYGSQKHHECKAGERSGRWWRVTLHVQTCSGRNRIIPLIRRPNTDSASPMPVTLPRNQSLILYVVMSPIHTVTIQCYGVGVWTPGKGGPKCSNWCKLVSWEFVLIGIHFVRGFTWYYFVKFLYYFPVVRSRSETPRIAECAGLGDEIHSLIRQLRKSRRRLWLFPPTNVLNYNEQLSWNMRKLEGHSASDITERVYT
jgi:hypothetical protein